MKADTNKDKGRSGLAIAIGYYGSVGYTVSVPLNDTQDYDLIVDKKGVLQKVQVRCTGSQTKYGSYSASVRSCGGTAGSVYAYVKDTDIDILFIVCTNGWMFELPKKEINQRSAINLSSKSKKYSKYMVSF